MQRRETFGRGIPARVQARESLAQLGRLAAAATELHSARGAVLWCAVSRCIAPPYLPALLPRLPRLHHLLKHAAHPGLACALALHSVPLALAWPVTAGTCRRHPLLHISTAEHCWQGRPWPRDEQPPDRRLIGPPVCVRRRQEISQSASAHPQSGFCTPGFKSSPLTERCGVACRDAHGLRRRVVATVRHAERLAECRY